MLKSSLASFQSGDSLSLTDAVSVSEEQFLTDENMVEAREASEEDLLVVHTKRYLNKLKVTQITHNTPLSMTLNNGTDAQV